MCWDAFESKEVILKFATEYYWKFTNITTWVLTPTAWSGLLSRPTWKHFSFPSSTIWGVCFHLSWKCEWLCTRFSWSYVLSLSPVQKKFGNWNTGHISGNTHLAQLSLQQWKSNIAYSHFDGYQIALLQHKHVKLCDLRTWRNVRFVAHISIKWF